MNMTREQAIQRILDLGEKINQLNALYGGIFNSKERNAELSAQIVASGHEMLVIACRYHLG